MSKSSEFGNFSFGTTIRLPTCTLCPIQDMVEKRRAADPVRARKVSWRSTKQQWLTGEMFKAVFPLPNDVFRLGLKSGELLVYIYLQYQKGAHSDQCWPSYATIGAAVGMSRKTVQKHIGALIDNMDSAFGKCFSSSSLF